MVTCAASAGMVLLNKAALSSFEFNAPMSLLFFQCVVCVALVRLSALLGKLEAKCPALSYTSSNYLHAFTHQGNQLATKTMPHDVNMGFTGIICIAYHVQHHSGSAAHTQMERLGGKAIDVINLCGKSYLTASLLTKEGCAGFIKVEPINFPIVKLWFPVNLIFVGMIFTSFFALKALGVPMATVLKNLTNLFTIGGDFLLYRKVRRPCQE